MSLVFLLLAQAPAAAPDVAPALTAPSQCDPRSSASGEIVVCGRRADGSSPYRINQPPARQPAVPKAEVQLGGGVSAGAETEQADVGGFPANRVMVRLKIKF